MSASAPPFTFGLQAAASFSNGRAAFVNEARDAEAAGFDAIYTFDHFGHADPFVPLMAAVEATDTIRVGSLVANAGFYNPALLARTAATLGDFTDGRFILGLGAGWAKEEFDAVGIPFASAKERVSALDEALDIVRALLTEEDVSRSGAHHAVTSASLGLRDTDVPLLVGGYGNRMIGLGARYADVFQFTGLQHRADGTPSQSGYSAEVLRDRVRLLDAQIQDREDGVVKSIVITEVHVSEIDDAQVDRLRQSTGLAPDEIAASPFVLSGDPSQIAEKVLGIREEYGISDVVVLDAEVIAPVIEILRN